MVMQNIDQYQLKETLGSGRSSCVVRARDTVLNRDVALKFLESRDYLNNKSALKEARALAQLSHPYIVTIYDFFEHDQQAILVMEYVKGSTLADVLNDGPLPVENVLELISQLVDAIAFSDKLKLVHGDIKPANIMLDDSNNSKLLDFGLSKFMDTKDILQTIETGSSDLSNLEGTLPYMAPEKIMGVDSGSKSDIFSLGALFYEIFSNKRAFAAYDQATTMNLILNNQPRPLVEYRKDAPEWLVQLISEMLEKDPNIRIDNIGEVKKRLEQFHRPISNFPPVKNRVFSEKLSSYYKGNKIKLAASSTLAIMSLFLWNNQNIANSINPSISHQINNGVDLITHFNEKDAILDAQSIFSNIITNDPDHAAANAGLSLSLLRKYTDQETDPATLSRATSLSEAALLADPHLAIANIAGAWCAEFNGDFAKAHGLYDNANILAPNHKLILEGRIRTYRKEADLTSLETILQLAVDTYPNHALFYGYYGDFLTEVGAYDKAEAMFRKSLLLNPNNSRSYANLAQSLHMQNKTMDAIKVIQDGLNIAQNSSLYNNLGTYLFFQGRYERSAAAFERTLDFEGNSHEFIYWANLADAYRFIPSRQEDAVMAYRRASQLLSKRLKTRPDHEGLNSRLALYSSKLGNKAETYAILDKILSSTIDVPNTYYRAMISYEVLGDRKKALIMLKQALKNGYPINEIQGDPELSALREDIQYHKITSKWEK